ncbi:MAG: PAS domain S-box protein, partial [Planctomycetia bacterium]|nr:PAS domain S-box protein [Planctomycetia bacterium]
MFEALARLFDTSGFVPRKMSGDWTPGLIWLHTFSDLLIWLAYVSIPLVLIYFTRRRDLPFPRIFTLFALLILACGTTHLIDALIFEYPIYRFAGFMKALTALISWITVIALIQVTPRVMDVVTQVNKSAADTKMHRVLPSSTRRTHAQAYLVAILAAVLAILIRASVDPLIANDHIFVVALLAVVYVSWQYGFYPAMVTLLIGIGGYTYLFVPPRASFFEEGLGNQLAIALFFFSGVVCAALGESQRSAQKKAKSALLAAVTRQEELESEVIRRRVVEAALRQRESELVSAQKELQASESRFRLMAQTVPSILWTAAPNGSINWVNDRWLEYCGLTAEENARGWPELVLHPDDYERCVKQWRESLASGTEYEIEVRNRRHDGVYRWFITRAIPVRDSSGAIETWFGVTTDIHDQKEAADAIRESEARFRSMANSVPALIWLTELSEQRSYFNKTWLEFTGRTLDEELGDGWIADIHPSDRDRYLSAYSNAFVSREPFELEYRLRR